MISEESSYDLSEIDSQDLEAATEFYEFLLTEKYQNQTFKLNYLEEG